MIVERHRINCNTTQPRGMGWDRNGSQDDGEEEVTPEVRHDFLEIGFESLLDFLKYLESPPEKLRCHSACFRKPCTF